MSLILFPFLKSVLSEIIIYFGFNMIGDGYFLTITKQEYGTIMFYLGYRFTPKKETK
jgi:hypothetical protein